LFIRRKRVLCCRDPDAARFVARIRGSELELRDAREGGSSPSWLQLDLRQVCAQIGRLAIEDAARNSRDGAFFLGMRERFCFLCPPMGCGVEDQLVAPDRGAVRIRTLPEAITAD